jgi:lysophospholipase L1-like esterase
LIFKNLFLLALVCVWLLSGPLQAQENEGETHWIDIKSLTVEGKGWEDGPDIYSRLPAKAEESVPPSVWNLSRHTSGLYVRFKTNATSIRAKWTLTGKNLAMPHFAATGVSGLDLYVRGGNGQWHWLAGGIPTNFPDNEVLFFENVAVEIREYMLYLPLYNGIENLSIGLPVEAEILNADYSKEKPLVFYGTSITQGGCASRAGMSTTAILGRQLEREIINLGFSGSGKMEPALAHLLAELDPALYFIDCLPNLEAQEVAERVVPFVRILREKHPEIPIVLAEGATYDDAFFKETRNQRNLYSRKALRSAYEQLLQEGHRNIYYQVGEGQLGTDGEGTVDGTHPTDLGFMRQAQVYAPLIQAVLQSVGKPSND